MLTSVDHLKKNEQNLGKARSYSEIVELLDLLKPSEYSQASLMRMK
jgi:hypothetical protein